MKELLDELEKLLKEDGDSLYGFIADNYYLMSKEDLKELALNILWLATTDKDDLERNDFYENLSKELEDRDFFND